MPGNSIIINDYTNPGPEREARIKNAKRRLMEIASIIEDREVRPIISPKGLEWRLEGMITRAARKIYRVPRRFTVGDTCDRCKTCLRICPEGNISLGRTIRWGDACSDCLACYHWCPKKAIHLGKGSADRPRYRHPEIKASDLFLR